MDELEHVESVLGQAAKRALVRWLVSELERDPKPGPTLTGVMFGTSPLDVKSMFRVVLGKIIHRELLGRIADAVAEKLDYDPEARVEQRHWVYLDDDRYCLGSGYVMVEPDLEFMIDGGRVVADLKTGCAGIHDSWWVQVAMYARLRNARIGCIIHLNYCDVSLNVVCRDRKELEEILENWLEEQCGQ